MQSSITILLLVSALCIGCYVQGAKVSILDIKVDVADNDIVESWTGEVSDSLVTSTVNTKQSCPDGLNADINIYQGATIVNQAKQKFEKPMVDFENYNICSAIETTDPDDDSCSIAQGEHSARDCDLRDWFSDLKPGDYKVECLFMQGDTLLSTITLDVLIEEE